MDSITFAYQSPSRCLGLPLQWEASVAPLCPWKTLLRCLWGVESPWSSCAKCYCPFWKLHLMFGDSQCVQNSLEVAGRQSLYMFGERWKPVPSHTSLRGRTLATSSASSAAARDDVVQLLLLRIRPAHRGLSSLGRTQTSCALCEWQIKPAEGSWPALIGSSSISKADQTTLNFDGYGWGIKLTQDLASCVCIMSCRREPADQPSCL